MSTLDVISPLPDPTPASPDALTPAMKQYAEQKKQVGSAILLFRMGDFYELFYDDAKLAARVLGITLTSRDNNRTPLAGIPYHALDGYLARLVNAGYKVAISEQLEDPKTVKGVVKRGVVRIVTPGTLTDEALLDRTQSNLVAAICREGNQAGIAALELSTGELIVQLCEPARLPEELYRLGPAEILLAEGRDVGRAALEDELREQTSAVVTYRPNADFSAARALQILEEQFGTRGLEGFGFERVDAALQAAAALIAYARETQKGVIRHLRPPRLRLIADHMVLDPVTLRSLEVERTLRTGERDGTLLAAVDQTVNPMGARLLRQWLKYPLRDMARIEARLRIIDALREDRPARAALRTALRDVGDIERIVGRLGVQRTHPRELRALGDGLARLAPLRSMLLALRREELDSLSAQLEGLDPIAQRLTTALRSDAPLTISDGGIFADGFHAEIDRLRGLTRDGQVWLGEFIAREQKRTGIPTLKVSYNKVFGYYIEITNAQRDRVPPDYVRRQTVKNAERYICDELKRHEDEVLSAETRANELERELFCELRDSLIASIPALQRAAGALATLDVLAGWAEIAVQRRYCRPEFVTEPLLEIEAGRHPSIEQALGPSFVANDTQLTAGGKSLALITGPNMAGKSTYIRQVATLALLAHCGSYVPATRMRLGLVDRIFTRVGASDELARGQSTFMVEMIETANILHNATRASLVILDEIGRGTSTFDGLSLAWAITEHLARNAGCRALFATHYHELTELGDLLEPVFNLNVAVREFEDQVVFLHRIVPGAADRSYGLHVAKLAGLPPEVLERANAVLNELEKTFNRQTQRPILAAVQRRRQRQLRLFEEPEETVVRELRETPVIIAGQTPQAADLIERWRRLLGVPVRDIEKS